MSRVVAVSPALAPHCYTQAEVTAGIAPLLTSDRGRRALLEKFHAASRVRTRHLALPLEKYAALRSFDEANDLFRTIGADLAEQAIRTALAAAGLAPQDVDFLLFTTVTGVGAPSLDALMVEQLGLRPDVKRLPSFGLGCVAGASCLARMHDYLEGHPDEVGVVLAVELCSLTIQHGDDSTANLVSSGLFGDGAAAAVMVGNDRARTMSARGLDVIGTRSALYPDTAGMLGWDIGGSGFRIVLGAGLSDAVETRLRGDVESLLTAHGAQIDDVRTWIAHPGGPRVLEAAARALDLDDDDLDLSWRSLAAVGNLSSASVLHVLADALAADAHMGKAQEGESHGERSPATGDLTVLFAFGPGVSSEAVLLRRPEED